jgi:hypothetical protein
MITMSELEHAEAIRTFIRELHIFSEMRSVFSVPFSVVELLFLDESPLPAPIRATAST